MPKISLSSWFKGDYQSQMEKHTSERTVVRNFLIRVNNQMDYSLYNKAYKPGIIIGKNEFLYEENYIKTYFGQDYIGLKHIKEKTTKIKQLQDTLQTKGIQLLIILAAGKGSFYPEYIPNDIHQERNDFTNHSTYSSLLKEKKINHIDFNSWFQAIKDTSRYPLFPRTGIHWSKYGEVLVADSIIKRVGQLTNKELPQINITAIETSSSMRGIDDDIEQSMNLLFDIKDLEMAYPIFTFKQSNTTTQPKLLTIGDSFYKDMFEWGLSNAAFSNGEFWYYNKQRIKYNQEAIPLTHPMGLKNELEKQDVIMLICTDANLKTFGFDFINQAHSIYFE